MDTGAAVCAPRQEGRRLGSKTTSTSPGHSPSTHQCPRATEDTTATPQPEPKSTQLRRQIASVGLGRGPQGRWRGATRSAARRFRLPQASGGNPAADPDGPQSTSVIHRIALAVQLIGINLLVHKFELAYHISAAPPVSTAGPAVSTADVSYLPSARLQEMKQLLLQVQILHPSASLCAKRT